MSADAWVKAGRIAQNNTGSGKISHKVSKESLSAGRAETASKSAGVAVVYYTIPLKNKSKQIK